MNFHKTIVSLNRWIYDYPYQQVSIENGWRLGGFLLYAQMKVRLGLLSVSHLANDFFNGVLVAILPLLHLYYGLTYTQMSLLVLVNNLFGGFFQPFLALFSDQREKPWFIPLGFLMLGTGIYAISWSGNFYWLLFAVMIASLGSAAYHPDANKCVHQLPGLQRGTIQSIFQIGGNAGMALAPLSLWFLSLTGLGGTIWLYSIAMVFACVFFFFAKRNGALQVKNNLLEATEKPPIKPGLKALVTVIACRTLANAGIVMFFPLFLIATYGTKESDVWVYSFLFLLGGAIGTLAGGSLGDRFGMRRVLQLSLILSAPLALLLPWMNGFTAMLLLFTLGLVLMSTFSVAVVFAQDLMPKRAGMASSLVIGFTGGLSGICLLVLGMLADRIGLFPILCVILAMPAIGAFLCFTLPHDLISHQTPNM
ncbi:MFS transporter [Brevibacillus laterosporus]|uniref:MFS transporter n=1 Tax=Brevibacillus laterosporus TaxID=1465 RepID=UPI0018CCEFA6|nr:MFS transporter [Brevibacillus laterosporus]MCR8935902.1 MFS transporter [Brevibacillus laterosporus]MCZ0838541.1 MFS transporter [Brevibacillus laterosporus]MCZ0843300.1 MFS transporter [Brevibacillus laterosporus]MED1910652.1 MFS transporter [Brevibacillus laterosporus]